MPIPTPLHTIPVSWRTRDVDVRLGTMPRTVLQLEAVRESRLKIYLVKFYDLEPGHYVDVVLIEQPVAEGAPDVSQEGDVRCLARSNLPPAPGVEKLKYLGRLETVLDHAQLKYPDNDRPEYLFRSWTGTLEIPRSACVGIVAMATRPCRCVVRAGGD